MTRTIVVEWKYGGEGVPEGGRTGTLTLRERGLWTFEKEIEHRGQPYRLVAERGFETDGDVEWSEGDYIWIGAERDAQAKASELLEGVTKGIEQNLQNP